MNRTLQIDTREAGPGHPVFVIAEIGVNHDGSLRLAKELVELAAACGADAVKLQIFTAANLMHSSSEFADISTDPRQRCRPGRHASAL